MPAGRSSCDRFQLPSMSQTVVAADRGTEAWALLSSAFTLEVSSPGLERPLRTPAHFARSVGELVIIKARAGVEGERRLKGTLASSDDTGIELAVEGAEPGQTQHLAFDEIERARTVFEWGPGPKPGGPKPLPSAKKKAAKS